MEHNILITVEINSNDLLDILKSGSDSNIKNFVELIEESYLLFDIIINELLSYNFDITNIMDDIKIGGIQLIKPNELKEIDADAYIIREIKKDLYLCF